MGRPADAARLLSQLADSLNACEQAGLKPKLRHGPMVETKAGIVVRTEAGWVPRTLAYTEFSPVTEGDDDD